MTNSQFYSIAIFGLLSQSYSLTVPVAYSSGSSPAGGLSSTEAYLDSLTNIGDTWSATSFEQSIQGVMVDAHTSSSSLEQPVLFGMHSDSSFDFDLADKLMGKVIDSASTLPQEVMGKVFDSVSETMPQEVPPIVANQVAELPLTDAPFMDYSDVVMGGPTPDITDLAAVMPSNDLSIDILSSTVANDIMAGAVQAATDIGAPSLGMKEIPAQKTEIMNQIATFAHEQQIRMADKIPDITPLTSAKEAIHKIQEQQAGIGGKVTEMTANMFKLPDKFIVSAADFDISHNLLGKGIFEEGTVAAVAATASLEETTNSIMESGGSTAEALGAYDQPAMSELSGGASDVIDQFATGTMQSLETVGNSLLHFSNTLFEKSTHPSLLQLIEGAQMSINKVVTGAIEAALSTVNAIGDITVRQMIQGLVQLVILVTKVLFQIINMLVAAMSGHGITEWADYATAYMNEQALQLEMMANSVATDISHKGITDLVSMTDSFLHQSTMIMAENMEQLTQAVGVIGEQAAAAAPFASALM